MRIAISLGRSSYFLFEILLQEKDWLEFFPQDLPRVSRLESDKTYLDFRCLRYFPFVDHDRCFFEHSIIVFLRLVCNQLAHLFSLQVVTDEFYLHTEMD